jgi:cholesterol oxidase
LAPFYEVAKRMLGANPSPRVGKADEILAEIGREIRGKDTFHINDVAVFFGEPNKTVPDPYFNGEGPERTGCTFCGACIVGCRVGAKNTLDKNYLYLAEHKYGIEIVPEIEVTGIRPLDGGYEVLATKSIGFRHSKRIYRANGVVVSGGVMGSVKLLLKCKAEGLLPHLSDQLGNYVRTNSETLVGVTPGTETLTIPIRSRLPRASIRMRTPLLRWCALTRAQMCWRFWQHCSSMEEAASPAGFDSSAMRSGIRGNS